MKKLIFIPIMLLFLTPNLFAQCSNGKCTIEVRATISTPPKAPIPSIKYREGPIRKFFSRFQRQFV